MFGPIGLNWEGKILRTLETMLAYIRRTTTQTGLQVSAFQVDQVYERGIKVEYDMQGRAYRQFDGDGNLITRIVYNANGSSTIYDANGNAETDTYDSHNVATRQVDQLNRAEDTVSSAASNFRPTSITNSAGQTLSMEWSRRMERTCFRKPILTVDRRLVPRRAEQPADHYRPAG